MDKIEIIRRDIDNVRESIRLDNEDIKHLARAGNSLNDLLVHIGWCMGELDVLKKRLKKAEDAPRH